MRSSLDRYHYQSFLRLCVWFTFVVDLMHYILTRTCIVSKYRQMENTQNKDVSTALVEHKRTIFTTPCFNSQTFFDTYVRMEFVRRKVCFMRKYDWWRTSTVWLYSRLASSYMMSCATKRVTNRALTSHLCGWTLPWGYKGALTFSDRPVAYPPE